MARVPASTPAPKTTATIAEILKTAGITRRTFNRWMEEGLVPRPRMVPGPSGRGQAGVWDVWVVERARRIKQLQGKGVPLDKITQTLDREVKADLFEKGEVQAAAAAGAADRWEQPHSADRFLRLNKVKLSPKQKLAAISLNDIYEWQVEAQARRTGLGRSVARRIAKAAKEPVRLRAVLGLALGGFSPVLLWDGSRLDVQVDFAVPYLLNSGALQGMARMDANLKDIPIGYVVINVWPVITRLWASDPSHKSKDGVIEVERPTPTFYPCPKIVSGAREDGPLMEYPVRLLRRGTHAGDLKLEILEYAGAPLDPILWNDKADEKRGQK